MDYRRSPKVYAYPSVLVLVALIGVILTPIGFVFFSLSLLLGLLLWLIRKRWDRGSAILKLDLS